MKNVDFSRIPARSRNVELGDQQNGESDRPQIEDAGIAFHALSDEIVNIGMRKKIGNRFGWWSHGLSLKEQFRLVR